MEAEELEALKDRIKSYENAKHVCDRLQKVSRTLDAIVDNEPHTIGAIVIDVQKGEFRYVSIEEQNVGGLRICAFSAEDHEALFDPFIEWARDQINRRIADHQTLMNEA